MRFSQSWDFYGGSSVDRALEKGGFLRAMMGVIELIQSNDCAEIEIEPGEPDWAGVRNYKITIRGVNPCA